MSFSVAAIHVICVELQINSNWGSAEWNSRQLFILHCCIRCTFNIKCTFKKQNVFYDFTSLPCLSFPDSKNTERSQECRSAD